MNKLICKNLQNIDRNKTAKSGVSNTEVEISSSVHGKKKTNFEKDPLKMCIVVKSTNANRISAIK